MLQSPSPEQDSHPTGTRPDTQLTRSHELGRNAFTAATAPWAHSGRTNITIGTRRAVPPPFRENCVLAGARRSLCRFHTTYFLSQQSQEPYTLSRLIVPCGGTDSRKNRSYAAVTAWSCPSVLIRLFEVNRDGVSVRLPYVFCCWLRCVICVGGRGCRRCGPACAGLPGCGTRMPGGLRVWRAGSGSRRRRS